MEKRERSSVAVMRCEVESEDITAVLQAALRPGVETPLSTPCRKLIIHNDPCRWQPPAGGNLTRRLCKDTSVYETHFFNVSRHVGCSERVGAGGSDGRLQLSSRILLREHRRTGSVAVGSWSLRLPLPC